jgi:hypothetical protein
MAVVPMKRLARLILAAAAVMALAGAAAAQTPRPRGEITLSLGAGFTRAEGGTVERQTWTTGPLAGRTVENSLALTRRPALFLGAWYTNFFAGAIGIQAGFGYLKSPLETRADFSRGLAGAPSQRLAADPDPSEAAAVPLFAALALGWRGPRSGIVLIAGPAVILHSLLAETRAGTMLAPGGSPAAFSVTASLPDQSWVAFGGIVGGALELSIGPATTLAFDARYVFSPARSFAWSFSAETAVGLDDSAARAAVDAIAPAAAAAGAPRISVNLSFLQLSMGITFKLGSL